MIATPAVPTVRAEEVFRTRAGTRYVRVRCPFCGDVHEHMWAGAGDDGQRKAHCAGPDYVIVRARCSA